MSRLPAAGRDVALPPGTDPAARADLLALGDAPARPPHPAASLRTPAP
jgi:hypothetical protein